MLRALLLTVFVSFSLQQGVNFVMMNKMIRHTTPDNLLTLVKALNADSNVAMQKTKIKTFVGTKWAMTSKTYSWYDNKTYVQKKACAFMDHRAAVKDFVTNFMPKELAKGAYFTTAVIEKMKKQFWMHDRFAHVSNPVWWSPFGGFIALAPLLITDKKKQIVFMDKFDNITVLYRKAQPAKYKQVFDFQIYDYDFDYARMAQVRN